MSWYQTLTWLEIFFGAVFILLYAGYIYRIKRLAAYFKQNANDIWIKFFLRSVYFFLLLMSVLGPSFGATKKEILTTGKDIFLLLDLSVSMNTQDVAPTRLERLKYELTQLIPAFNADRIGLISFSSEPYLQCPLTYDQSALLLYNQMLQTNLVPRGGANFKAALELASQKFGERKLLTQETEKARIIVLLSDGEDVGDGMRPVLQKLKNQNIRVFTVGVGSEEGGPVPVGKNFVRDKQGQRIISRLQRLSLSQIASETKGQYFELNNQEDPMENLVRVINNIEGEKRESQTVDITANKYSYPLLAALALILADVLLTVTVIKL